MNTLFKTVTSNAEDNQVVSLQAVNANDSQEIIIKDLELMMSIGVLDSEMKDKQRVIVNAEINVIDTATSDDISNVVSYADIIEQIKEIAQEGHINLVETFARKIINACFDDNRIQSVTVLIEKPDIISDVRSVGVKMTRKR
jgi:dihydroneopterin aldolase